MKQTEGGRVRSENRWKLRQPWRPQQFLWRKQFGWNAVTQGKLHHSVSSDAGSRERSYSALAWVTNQVPNNSSTKLTNIEEVRGWGRGIWNWSAKKQKRWILGSQSRTVHYPATCFLSFPGSHRPFHMPGIPFSNSWEYHYSGHPLTLTWMILGPLQM